MEKHCTIQSQFRTIISNEKEIINNSKINKQIPYFYKSLYPEKICFFKKHTNLFKTVSILALSKERHDSC